jgi:hypothetical protein
MADVELRKRYSSGRGGRSNSQVVTVRNSATKPRNGGEGAPEYKSGFLRFSAFPAYTVRWAQ